ncbi:DUF4136 domain-containing protein [Alginatibacterium sediminis]|uniref:DUF4136 domain-containing protein n=1 Tax=Alginatibacterium sediminis TaxID=2164068 RepID=A0A420EA12_9ALTE|nr:DUF4136 domain-containing protein [Alginatibacterium sediminis]RKF17510.1 DUF4136 domain-containing protein [Alginatibacterium sediminis]
MRKIFLLALINLLVACASPQIDQLPDHDFTQYQSFAFVEQPDLESLDFQRLQRQVTKLLQLRGLQLQDQADAQLLVDAKLIQDFIMQGRGGGSRYRYNPYYDDLELVYEPPTHYVQQNYQYISISFVDTSLNQSIWSATNVARLYEKSKTPKRELYFEKQLVLLFESFPIPVETDEVEVETTKIQR